MVVTVDKVHVTQCDAQALKVSLGVYPVGIDEALLRLQRRSRLQMNVKDDNTFLRVGTPASKHVSRERFIHAQSANLLQQPARNPENDPSATGPS